MGPVIKTDQSPKYVDDRGIAASLPKTIIQQPTRTLQVYRKR